MGTGWMDHTDTPFDALLLLEGFQLGLLPGWVPERELGVALAAHPHVAWFMRHKNPKIADWLDGVLAAAPVVDDSRAVRGAEMTVLECLDDLLVYVLEPGVYDRQPFLGWDDSEVTDVVDLGGKVVVDVGAGTGRLTRIAAAVGAEVHAVEPVGRLRDYLRDLARRSGWRDFFAIDGTITALPFADGFADVVLGGHVYGDDPAAELTELRRVTRPGGTVLLCPATVPGEEKRHAALVAEGFEWAEFTHPGGGAFRKYWQHLDW